MRRRPFGLTPCPLLKRHLHPEGPIVPSRWTMKRVLLPAGAYVLDYHPDSILWYRNFLEKRYGNIGALNNCYGSRYGPSAKSSAAVLRRKKPEDLPYYLDWSRYKEWQINECLRILARMWRERGFRTFPFPEFFRAMNSPITPPRRSKGIRPGCGGLDDYPRKEQFLITSRKATTWPARRASIRPRIWFGLLVLAPVGKYHDPEDQSFTTPSFSCSG